MLVTEFSLHKAAAGSHSCTQVRSRPEPQFCIVWDSGICCCTGESFHVTAACVPAFVSIYTLSVKEIEIMSCLSRPDI